MFSLSSSYKFFILSSLGLLSACSTITYYEPFNIFSSNESSNEQKTVQNLPPSSSQQTPPLLITAEVANRLVQLNNEVKINNILHVSHESVTIDNVPYTLLNFHTINQGIYRTRVETQKITAEHFQKLQKLKNATLIGVLKIEQYPNQFFFRNFKDLEFHR